MEVSGEVQAQATLCPRKKKRRYPFNVKLGGLQTRSSRFCRRKNSQDHTENRTSGSIGRRQILYSLRYDSLYTIIVIQQLAFTI